MSEVFNQTIPDDLVADILLRLPTKQICRLRCVSKPWQSFISNPQFARAHLKSSIHDLHEFILTSSSSDHAPYILNFAGASTASCDGVARKVLFQSEQKSWPLVAGSCDGLVLLLLHDSRFSKMLFNPVTLETAQIRDDRPIDCPVDCRSGAYGFGYDSLSDDYKIVSLNWGAGIHGSLVDVYSLRMKRWKRIVNCPCVVGISPYDKHPSPGVFLNGCLHWYGIDPRKLTHELVCFDLAREEFVQRLLPASLGQFAFDIKVLEGRLTLVHAHYSESYGYWHHVLKTTSVTQEYGVLDSWTKFTTEFIRTFPKEYNAVCVLNEDEIVLEKGSEKLLAFNRKNGVCRDLAIAGLPEGFHRVMPFRGSFLSPN